jgi:small neutral amino acid transporter SnatA (MarC family)
VTLWSATILLFLVLDPLGNILLFTGALQHVPAARRARVIARELSIAYTILVIFLFVGGPLLRVLGISGPALTIAGGMILFLIALRMVFPSPETTLMEVVRDEPFIVPLAIPYVAGMAGGADVGLAGQHADSGTRQPYWRLPRTKGSDRPRATDGPVAGGAGRAAVPARLARRAQLKSATRAD